METRKSSCTSLHGVACPSGEHVSYSDDFEAHAFSQFLFDPTCFGSESSPLEDGNIFEPSKCLELLPGPKAGCIHQTDTLNTDQPLDLQSQIWPNFNNFGSTQPNSCSCCHLGSFPSNSSSWMFRPQDLGLNSPSPSDSSFQQFQGLDMAKSSSRSSSHGSYESFMSDQSQSVVSTATPSGDYCMGCLSKAFDVPNISYSQQCQPSYIQQIQSTPPPAPPLSAAHEHSFCISPGNSFSLPPLSPHTTSASSPPTISLSSTPPPPLSSSSQQSKKRKRSDESREESTTIDSPLVPIRTKAMKDGGHNCYSGSHWEGPEIWTPEKMEQSKPKKRKMPTKRSK